MMNDTAKRGFLCKNFQLYYARKQMFETQSHCHQSIIIIMILLVYKYTNQ